MRKCQIDSLLTYNLCYVKLKRILLLNWIEKLCLIIVGLCVFVVSNRIGLLSKERHSFFFGLIWCDSFNLIGESVVHSICVVVFIILSSHIRSISFWLNALTAQPTNQPNN